MRPGDFNRFAEIWAQPDPPLHSGNPPPGRGRAWECFLRIAGHWQMTGFGQWGVVEQNSSQLIGQVGFSFGTCALGEDFDPFPETGWVIASETQGRELGLEAARAAHDWFDRIMPGPLVARIRAANEPDLRLAAETGYAEIRRTRLGGESVVLLRRNGPPLNS